MKLSTESYKGVRDFYPSEMKKQKYIFDTWKSVVELYGYEEYGSSVLEPSELYKAKSGEEIVTNETYSFIDRGGREVTLRPEMTPTVARMVAARRRELAFPLRWYSIPNLFRYERPQRGRLREHWQLNVDLFGDTGIDGEVEMIEVGFNILKKFGLKAENFEIRINDRNLVNETFKKLEIDESKTYQLQKLIDKKNKINDFDIQAEAILGYPFEYKLSPNDRINSLIKKLSERGVSNVIFDDSIMRGFDYYTGIVFEFYDLHPENRRSLFGGGRYDNLLDIFENDSVSAVGFGTGDVGMLNALETYGLMVEQEYSPSVGLCLVNESSAETFSRLEKFIRDSKIITKTNTTLKSFRSMKEWSEKSGNRFTIFVGEKESSTGMFTINDNLTNTTNSITQEMIPAWINKELSKE